MQIPRRLLVSTLLATSTLLGSVGCRDNAAVAPTEQTAEQTTETATIPATPPPNSELSDEDRRKLEDNGVDVSTYEVLKDVLKESTPQPRQ